MQVDRLGEENRHQHVAVQGLDDAVGDHHIGKLAGHAEVEAGHRRHRQGGHRGADIGHQHREAHQHRQQGRVGQAEEGKGQEGDGADDDDLDELAAHIVGDLGVHLVPDAGHQGPLLGQQRKGEAHQRLAVLEQEEDQDRHQHQVDDQRQHVAQRRQRQSQGALPELGHLAAGHGDPVLDLVRGDQVGVAFLKVVEQLLPAGEHPRRLLYQPHQLVPDQRHQDEGHGQQHADEG